MSSTVPEGQRRTRRLGASPGGFKSLDLNAPTRRRNAPRATTTTAATTQPPSAPSHSQNKRKNNNEHDAEDRPAKKTRATQPPKASKASRSTRVTTGRTRKTRETANIKDGGNAMVSGSLHAQQYEEHDVRLDFSDEARLGDGTSDDAMSERSQDLDSHVTKQQPTPPAEHDAVRSKTRSSAKRQRPQPQEAGAQASTQQVVLKTPQNDNFLANMLEVNRKLMDDYEPEKPISDCDDDEFAARLPGLLGKARQTDFPKRGSRPSNTLAHWVRDGRQAVWLRERATATVRKGSPSEHNLLKPRPDPLLYQGLSCMERRELTNMAVIDAISAGIDWLEKNRDESIPTSAEMTSLLDDFKRSKKSSTQNSLTIASPPITESHPIAAESNSFPVQPKTPRNDPVDASSELNTDEPEVEDEEKENIEANAQDSMVIDHAAASPTAPQTAPKQEPAPARGWASALSANLITNVLLTPTSWFSRRDRARQDLSATEPRPAKKQTSPTKSAQPDRKARTPAPVTTHVQSQSSRPRITTTGNEMKLSKTPSSHRSYASFAPPATPTPASRQPRRGRPDSHLPVHLRGVRYEDLPPEYQAISQHMKKERPIHEDEEEEEVDIPALLALAEKTRRERDLKEAQEKAARLSREASVIDDAEAISESRTGQKRKRIVKVKQPKKFIANLAPGTFGMPVNIDDSSSEEEVDMEVDVSFSSAEGQGRRKSLSKNSSLRRSPDKMRRTDREESDEEYDEGEKRPTKKQRTVEPSDGHPAEEDEDAQDPLYNMKLFIRHTSEEGQENRPNSFLDMPPRESEQLRKEAREYEEMKPRGDENMLPDEVIGDPDLAKTVALFKKFDRKSAEEKARTAGEESQGFDSDEKPPTTGRALQEIQDTQVNKVRERIQKYTPKNPSSLRNVKIMSPIAEKNESEKVELAPGIDDPEVIAAIMAIPEEDIVAYNFGPPPNDLFPQFSAHFAGTK